jgi:1-acyl-sn-glycerol-3-phosphate acyltransferase
MIWLRSTLYAFGMVVVTPLFSLIALLIFPLPPITRYRIISGWARSMLVWLRLTCGLKYRILGTENIPQTPVVILSKHQSAWETLA